jgi:hypothetical protein
MIAYFSDLLFLIKLRLTSKHQRTEPQHSTPNHHTPHTRPHTLHTTPHHTPHQTTPHHTIPHHITTSHPTTNSYHIINFFEQNYDLSSSQFEIAIRKIS